MLSHHHSHITAASEVAAPLLKRVREGDAPPWCTALQATLPPPPQELVQYVPLVCEYGPEGAASVLFDDAIVPIPPHRKSVISGNGTKALRFRSPDVTRHFEMLFHAIRDHSPETVVLEPWDLSHAHLAAHDSGDQKDLVVLFHAKEFPKEYRPYRAAPVLPIGCEEAGGESDPRLGTQHSTSNPTYHLRNYLYLTSTNTIYLLHPTHPDFDQHLLHNSADREFHTVTEARLGRPLGDVNYIAWEQGDPLHLLASPRDGFGPSLHLSAFLRQLKEHAHTAPASFPPHFPADEAHVFLTATTSTTTTTATTTTTTVTTSTMSSSVQSICDTFGRLDHAQLEYLQAIVEEQSHIPSVMTRRIPHPARPMVSALINHHRHALDKKQADHNTQERKKLTDQGIRTIHAHHALAATANKQGSYSAFRAHQLLQVMYPEYRPDSLLEVFGKATYDEERATKMVSEVFYADSALEALALADEKGLGVREAGQIVMKRKEQATQQQMIEALEKRMASAAGGAPHLPSKQ